MKYYYSKFDINKLTTGYLFPPRPYENLSLAQSIRQREAELPEV